MKKTTITFLLSALLIAGGVKAQSIQEGINHLNADRFKSAIAVFDKLLATNPNNIEATYWKGQVYFDDDNNAAAADLYSKALQASANAPLILVGMGHVDLLEKRTNEARQKFESALTATRNARKGDDPVILTAVGRANADAKLGDFMYAIEKLEAAVLKDPKNPEVYLQLGNAYRKARPGEGGGKAYENYKKALEVKPDFAVASIRLAKIFETQRNWELVLQYLNDAARQDPKFAPAYYELFYYYFFRLQYPEAEAQLQKYIANMDQDVQNDFLYAQLCWARKDWECAITKSNTVIAAMGNRTKPKVLKLLADTYFIKGDYVNAKKYSDEYFVREKPEDFNKFDFQLKADIMSKMGAPCEELFGLYIQGAAMDTVLQSKIDYLTVIADSFKARKCPKQQADMQMVIYNMRAKPNPASLISIGITYSQAGELQKADSIISAYTAAFPDSIYGHYWTARVNFSSDTTMSVEPHATKMINGYQKTLEIAEKDLVRYKSLGVTAAQFLAGYYNNIKSDKALALTYTNRGLVFDSTNATLKYIKQVLEKPTKSSSSKSNTPKPKPNVKPKAIAAVNKAAIKK